MSSTTRRKNAAVYSIAARGEALLTVGKVMRQSETHFNNSERTVNDDDNNCINTRHNRINILSDNYHNISCQSLLYSVSSKNSFAESHNCNLWSNIRRNYHQCNKNLSSDIKKRKAFSMKVNNEKRGPSRLSPMIFNLYTVSILSLLLFVNIVNAQSLANSFFTEPDVHPGFVCKVGPKAFQLMSDYLRQRVGKFMKFGALQYNNTVNLTPLVRFSITSSNFFNFDAVNFQSQFTVNAGRDVTWTGSSLKTTVNSVYKLLSSSGEVTGQVPVTFDKTTVKIDLTSGVNADGHLKMDALRCRASVGDLRVDFTPADAELLRNYLPLIHRAIREQIDSFLCPTFSAELVPVIANRLLNSPMSAALFDHYFINYGLIGPVNYSGEANGTIELRHRGNVFGILRQGRTRLNDFRLPFRSASLPLSTEPQKHMLTFQFSNYTLSSLLFWMDQYRKFDYEISKNSVNDSSIAGYLKTDCGAKDICAGTLFPEFSAIRDFAIWGSAEKRCGIKNSDLPNGIEYVVNGHMLLPSLNKNFPNGVVSIKTHTVTYPHVRFENGKAFVIVDSRIDAFVTQPDRNRRFLTASMLAELSVTKANFKDYTLHAQLTMDTFHITDVVSLVEGIDAGSIEFLINALNELIIADDMAKKLKDGIKLPILFDFEQSHSEVHFEKDRMWIGTDFCFDDNCQRAALNGQRGATGGGKHVGQNTDMDVNYYDATG